MNYDISGILSGWDYDPSSVSARWIKGQGGKLKLQLRLDLGLFQMEAEGRPDGAKPRGYESLLDYYASLEKTSTKKSLELDSDACSELQQESMQYYYRYLSFYALHHFDGVIADTEHNLKLIDFVTRHAENEDLAWQFLQFYPYVRMMNARAKAEKLVEVKAYEEAIGALQKALDDIQVFWLDYGDNGDFGNTSQEIELLTDLLKQVKKRKPKSSVDKLREQLAHAIDVENYEKAAVLRDKINAIDQRKQSRKNSGKEMNE